MSSTCLGFFVSVDAFATWVDKKIVNSLFLALASAALLAVRMPPVRYGGSLQQEEREEDDCLLSYPRGSWSHRLGRRNTIKKLDEGVE